MEVIFYSTHCPRCKVLETKLKRKNINYTEVNDTQEMLSLGIKTAPVLSVDGNIMDFGQAVSWINAWRDTTV